MNRYPLWKYLVILAVTLIGLLYALPNLFGEAPAVQVSAGRATVRARSSCSAARNAGRWLRSSWSG